MSRKHKRQKHQKSFPWSWVVLGGVILLIAAYLLANQGAGNGSGTPVIVVDQQRIDYGYVPFGNNKTFTIKITNTGDGALRFKDKPYIEVVEGC